MRIVAGKFRGKRLAAPPDGTIRPTADRVRKNLFNILSHSALGGGWRAIDGAAVLDVFAGTGALGLEALSRGAARVTFIDNEESACRLIARNVAALGANERCEIRRADALRPGAPAQAHDLVLADPPYGSGLGRAALAVLAARGWIAEQAICVLELAAKEALDTPGGFEIVERRTYGAASLAFLRYEAHV